VETLDTDCGCLPCVDRRHTLATGPTRHLYHIDNVNFARALDDFKPAPHQPQPPGDPLYVALTRCLRPFTPSVEILFPVSGILGSAAAMAALWWVGQMLFGVKAAGWRLCCSL
jgi:hypothetical protein